MTEKCARCGDVGEDRRTLFMSCFYAMDELKIPFEKSMLFQTDLDKLVKARDSQGFEIPCGPRITLVPGTVTTTAELSPREFYTLRVCKDCRAAWMHHIEKWFGEVTPAKSSVGSGIFVRRNGANVEISEEEWHELHPGREPVRLPTESPEMADE